MASSFNSSLNKYLLLVDIRGGSDLPKNCYVKIIVDEQDQKTTVSKDENPIWNEKMLFRFDHIPEQIEFRVKLDRTLLPNTTLGDYIIDIHCSSENQDLTKPIKLVDGVIALDHAEKGKLDVKLTLHDINELTINDYNQAITTTKEPNTIQQPTSQDTTLAASNSSLSGSNELEKKEEILNDNDKPSVQTTNNVASNQENIIEHVPVMKEQKSLSKSLIKESNNNLIENYDNNNTSDLNNNNTETVSNKIIEQPIEITRRIIHVEKPKIIEVPIYKEIHEYIREEPQYITQNANVITQDIGSKDVSSLSEEELNRLKQYANISNDNNNNNLQPIIEIQKEQIPLAPEIRELPPQIHEKEIIYEQPIEIERLHIEKVKPIVHEEVKILNEHVLTKMEPQTQTIEPVIINEGHKYYSKDVNDLENLNSNTKPIDDNTTNLDTRASQ